MNKTAIKNFAIQARNKLIADVCYRAGLVGITEKGIQAALPQSDNTTEFYDIGIATPYAISGQAAIRQRRNLAEAIRRRAADSDYPTAYRCVMEEVAYTWFNRLIAVRFMEVNDYLPGRVRVLSSESGKIEPDLVTNPFDAELRFTAEEEQTILQLKQDNKLDELFRLLFIKQCNALAAVLPALFEQTEDYTELLLNLSVVDQEGVVWHLTHDIPEDDFNVEKGGQVEIIGWLYQYYNTEPKAQVFARPSGQKIRKEEIPAATQLFTPDWIVRYMVENSLGRLWLEGHPSEGLRANWNYYLDEAEQEPDVAAQLEAIRVERRTLAPEDIKIIDPCMGSGHILVYAFDVLMQIYESAGWERREAAQSIVRNNLYGLDIDKRAWQLAYFAVMMKARQYDRRFFTRNLQPMVYSTTGDEDGENFGSLLTVDEPGEMPEEPQSVYDLPDYERRLNVWNYRYLLAQRYHVVVTNPPYMAVSNASGKVQEYVKKNFPDSKADLFAVFIERCGQLVEKNGLQAMITQYVWMYKTLYCDFRATMLNRQIVNMIHLGSGAFDEISGEVVNTTAFVLGLSRFSNYRSTFMRLTDYVDESGKNAALLEKKNTFLSRQDRFRLVNENIYAYWISENVFDILINAPTLDSVAFPRKGLTTGDNDRFVRLWYEVHLKRIGLHGQTATRWYPMTKGGNYRRWYGNNDYIVNWENDGFEIRNFKDTNGKLRSRPQNIQFYFHEAISWNDTGSGNLAFRYQSNEFIPNASGPCVYTGKVSIYYLIGLFNSKISQTFMQILAPALKFEVGQVARYPIIVSKENIDIVEAISNRCISLSKTDWDSFETSWDFTRHPLVEYRHSVSKAEIDPDWNKLSYYLKDAYEAWEYQCQLRFDTLKANEEELNRIFIDIYGLQDELTPEVEDKDVTVRRANLGRDIRSLLSYAVGCMFGRYSLDVDGLAYAGGEWDAGKYSSFQPDADNILPLTDEAYLEDDIITRLCQWLRVVYGPDTLEENLDFIAKALGNKGTTSREVIRSYFLKDFFADHCKIYQKRPIYWLFDSGKQNGFKALIYLHRYTPDTIGKLRVDYLHRLQRVYASEIERMQDMIDNSKNPREVAASTKRKEKLQKQLKECREYDEKIAHLALARIELDLDDGVKVNYRKLQTASDGKLYEVLADSKNIMGKQ